MRRLSATSTYGYKRAIPITWVGGLALRVVLAGAASLDPNARRSDEPWVSLGFPFVFILFVFIGAGSVVIFKTLIADRVDEVWPDSEQSPAKNRGAQTVLTLTDVFNVNTTRMTHPRCMTPMRRVASRIGQNITFIPDSPRRLTAAFKPGPIASERIDRIDALREVRR